MDTVSEVVIIMLRLACHVIKRYNMVLLTLYYVHIPLMVYTVDLAFIQYKVLMSIIELELKPQL